MKTFHPFHPFVIHKAVNVNVETNMAAESVANAKMDISISPPVLVSNEYEFNAFHLNKFCYSS